MYNRMKKAFCMLTALLLVLNATAQSVSQKLAAAFAAFEKDPQLKSGLASICVVDGPSGSTIFEKNSRIGLAPASTQKIITAAAAYEVLGKGFRYETRFGYYGSLNDSMPSGGLFIKPSGDPTLGSWRWPFTTEAAVMKRLLTALQNAGIKRFNACLLDERGWESEAIPGGWIWDDVGNYYGAGAGALNWRENQYDLILKSGPTRKDAVVVVRTEPRLYGIYFTSHVTAAARGTGDNSYIYLPVGGNVAHVRGTIPVAEDRFVIAGAIPSPTGQVLSTLNDSLSKQGAPVQYSVTIADNMSTLPFPSPVAFFHTETSPPLDSIIHWFLKRSINLYGEALAKTMALRKGKTASTENGAEVIRSYWKEKNIGIDETEVNMVDGSGLSPQNRVTTHAQVAVLQYAQKQPWFSAYHNAFPQFNGMKLKSGTIGGAKSFCGYHTGKNGKAYIVSFIVNNYNGPSSSLVQKMYKILDLLK
jgi:serine-type D-Ala-D-Ala carboxypeptidase/endopeptidase (penicillin-binding protein 4)